MDDDLDYLALDIDERNELIIAATSIREMVVFLVCFWYDPSFTLPCYVLGTRKQARFVIVKHFEVKDSMAVMDLYVRKQAGRLREVDILKDMGGGAISDVCLGSYCIRSQPSHEHS